MQKYLIYISLLLVYIHHAEAQHNYELNVYGAAMTVQAGAELSVLGDVRLNGAAALTNNGVVRVEGHLYDESTSAQQSGTGTVKFQNANVNVGQQQQIICSGGANLTGAAAFYDVWVDNSHASDKLVYLNNGDVEVKNTLNFFNNNRIRTATSASTDGSAYTNYLYLSNPASSAIINAGTSGATSQYVEGRLRWNVAAGNTYTLPIGISPTASGANGNQPLTFALTSGNGILESAFTKDAGGALTNATTCGANLACIADHGYWNLDAVSGLAAPIFDVIAVPANVVSACTSAISDYVIALRPTASALAAYQYLLSNGNVCTSGNYTCTLSSIPRTALNSLNIDVAVGRLSGTAGTLGTAASVCAGNNTGTLNLVGYVGNISKWQYDNGSGFLDISNSTASQSYTNLSTTTQYHTNLTIANCTTLVSNNVVITVNPTPSATTCKTDDPCQTASGSIKVQIVGGTSPYTITYSPVGTPVSPIITSALSTTISGLTGGQTYNFVVTDANGCIAP